MEKLFLDINRQRVPISDDMTKKYKLQKGMVSTVSHNPIVDEFGGAQLKPESTSKKTVERQKDRKASDFIVQENLDLSTSEILDFSQGADSD
jgi:hypothetical protein